MCLCKLVGMCVSVWCRGACVCVCGVCVCMCLGEGMCLSCMVVRRLVKHVYLYMHFVALLDHHNSKTKVLKGKRLHLKCSPDRYLLIRPLTKKIK